MRIERVMAANDAVRALIGELDAELAQHYAPEQQHGLAIHELFEPCMHFFVAYDGERYVGCGGIALFGDFAEIKRVYVRVAFRGCGAAAALLGRLEAEAMDAGIRTVRLETGTEQYAAIRFYQRHGFRPCKAFGTYAAMPRQAIEQSLFFEKVL